MIKASKFFLIIFLILLFIPLSFAADNTTDTNIGSVSGEILSSDYYFNASSDDDGNGTIDNPYNTIAENKLKQDSVNYLANGEYDLNFPLFNIDNSIFILGEDVTNTILKSNHTRIIINKGEVLTLQNLTLLNISIFNNGGYLNITNCIFKNSLSLGPENGIIKANLLSNNNLINSSFIGSYTKNSRAIYLFNSTLNANNICVYNFSSVFGGGVCSVLSNVTFNNFTAKNNNASYQGGVIYHLYGKFSIVNGSFTSNSAIYGGALFIDNSSSLTLNNIKFKNNYALKYAGALYSLLNLNKTVNNLTFFNNTALKYMDLYDTNIPNSVIGNGNYTLVNYNSTFNGTIPSFYDLRLEGLVSSVKAQGVGGNCWAFAALGALESCLLKATGKEYDLSEENMKNLMSLYSDYGWNRETNKGGFDDMAISYLINWLGPIHEVDEVYNQNSILSQVFNSIFHIQNIIFLKRDNFTDNNAIKEAILKYGAVATQMHRNESYQKGNNHYYNGNMGCNHAVCIVGWDDSYSKNKFRIKPPGDGAWIVKNSWGSDWCGNGYFYVSYYDTKFAPVGRSDGSYTFILNDNIKYDKNYQYDIVGKTDYLLSNRTSVWYKNIFNSTDNEFLRAVSTYFEKKCNWELSIYVNNTLKLIKNGSSTAGYYTIDLGTYISLNPGDIFEVIFKITCNDVSFPIFEKVSSNKVFYSPGISYFSWDGENWTDLYDFNYSYPGHTYKSQVACIKAFTLFNKTSPISVNYNESIDYGDALEIKIKLVNGSTGNLTIILDGKIYNLTINNASANISIANLNAGFYEFKIFYPGDNNHNPAFITNNLKVNKIKSVILANNTTLYYNGNFTAKLISSGKALVNEDVIIVINGNNYNLKSDVNGLIYTNLTLPAGNYQISIIYNGNTNYLSSNANFIITSLSSIESNNLKRGYNSDYDFKAKFLDKSGQALINTNVNFTVNNKKYIVKSDGFGVVYLKLKLNVGKYLISFTNPETLENNTNAVKIIKRLSANKDINAYFTAKTYYKVRVYGDDGKVVGAGEIVTFKINGKSYFIKTDSKGYASLKVNLNPKKYKIAATYKGFKVLNNVVIKSLLITKNLSKKKAKTIKFTAKLVNNQGKILKNKKITFKFKGKTYKIKTNKKGVATLKLKNLKVGKYDIYSIYGKSKVKNTIIIKK